MLKEYIIFFWQDAAEPTTQEELERRLKKLEKVAFPFGSTKTNNSFTVYICNPFFLLIVFKYKHYELFSSSTVHEIVVLNFECLWRKFLFKFIYW